MNYEIIYPSGKFDSDEEPIMEVVDVFSAEDRDGAAKFIETYNKEHGDRTYYYRNKVDRRIGICHDDRIVTYYDCNEMLNDIDEEIYDKIAKLRIQYRKLKSSKKETKDIVGKIGRLRKLSHCRFYRGWLKTKISVRDFCEWWFYEKWYCLLSDIKLWFRKMHSFAKTGHDISESWGLDTHFLGDLRYNLVKLMDEGVGIPPNFVEEAVMELYPDVNESNMSEWWRTHSVTPEIDELSLKKRDEVWSRIVHLIDLYRFYTFDIGTMDREYTKEDMVDFYFPGTYQEIDYRKMAARADELWNEIMDSFKKYGRGMWN